MAQSYLSRGVSPTKDDVKKAVADQDAGLFPGAFCKIIPDIAGDPDYCMAIHADGAGTKSAAAYLMYRETGDPMHFFHIAQDALVMNTDDLACIGMTTDFYLSNTIGRNAHRIDGACIAAVIKGYDDMIARMAKQGIRIVMTGGETADVGDLVATMIVDSTLVARAKKDHMISAANILPGDAIVGLASYGKASYEDKENSGISSNGLTAARHMLLHKDYLDRYPESVSATMPRDKAYCGQYHLNDCLPGSAMSVGEALLSPTRTYLPVLAAVYKKHVSAIRGVIHCTGGGQVKCKDFGNKLCYVKDHLFDMPPIFKAILASGEIPKKEMYQVFNCGHRIEIYCNLDVADDIISITNSFQIDAQIIGRVEKTDGDDNMVIIKDGQDSFVY